jgi:glycosyltransferase involved in cell wall biosynthesis
LRPFYAAADVVALPSDHEGFPYALLEAAAAGRALIGSNVPGITCAVRHRETGLLIDLSREDSLLSAICECASSPSSVEKWANAARLRVEREFDRTAVLQEISEFYRGL